MAVVVLLCRAGVLMFSIVVVTVHIEVIQIEEQWTWLHHLAIWLSQGGWAGAAGGGCP